MAAGAYKFGNNYESVQKWQLETSSWKFKTNRKLPTVSNSHAFLPNFRFFLEKICVADQNDPVYVNSKRSFWMTENLTSVTLGKATRK